MADSSTNSVIQNMIRTSLGPNVDSYKVYTPTYSIIATWLKEDGVDETGGPSNYQLIISTDEIVTTAVYRVVLQKIHENG